MTNDALTIFVRRTLIAATTVAFGCVVLTTGVYALLGEPDWAQVESPYLVARDTMLRDGGFDTVFIGSSVTFRQIDPEVVDAQMNQVPGIRQQRSLNLGNPGLFPPRSTAYLKQLIHNPPTGLRRIYAELFRLDEITANYRAPEIMHNLTPAVYIDTLKTIAAANFSSRYKAWLCWQYTRAVGYKYAGFSLLSYRATERDLKPFMRERLAEAPLGFYAKDAELAASVHADNVATIRRVRNSFLANDYRLDGRRQLHANKYARNWSLTGSPYVDQLNELIRTAKSKDIDLIFVLPPLLTPRGVEFAYPVFLQLPESQRIDLSDPGLYPQLYAPEYLFDLEHVNAAGATRLSELLASETLRLRRPDPGQSVTD